MNPGRDSRGFEQDNLLRHFYEPLVLLYVLGQTRGNHITTSIDDGPIRYKQRQFLNDLAYICDFEKAGKTTTAIAVQNRTDDAVFRFAVNDEITKSDKAQLFLTSALYIISGTKNQRLLPGQNNDTTDTKTKNLLNLCLKAAQLRIDQEIDLLFRNISTWENKVNGSVDQADQDLLRWMADFQSIDRKNHLEICFHAYNHRKDTQMTLMKKRGEQDDQKLDITRNIFSPLSAIQHYIGRLAAHVRRPKRLVEERECFDSILNNKFEVLRVTTVSEVSMPGADKHTKLDNIMGRMLQDNDPRYRSLDKYQAKLEQLDHIFGILGSMKEEFQKPKKPCVHAEIQVLEHFWTNELEFALEGYRFIGCSKPACYCCRRYIEHHPLKCVVPDSHEKIWLRWSPPLSGDQEPFFGRRRDVLQKVIKDICNQAIDQIDQGVYRLRRWRPDSNTEITRESGQRFPLLSSSFDLGTGESSLAPGTNEYDNRYLSMSPFSPSDSDRLTSRALSSSPGISDARSPNINDLSNISSPDSRELEMELENDSDDGGVPL